MFVSIDSSPFDLCVVFCLFPVDENWENEIVFIVGVEGTEERVDDAIVDTMDGTFVVIVQDANEVVFGVVEEAADAETLFIPVDVVVAVEANRLS